MIGTLALIFAIDAPGIFLNWGIFSIQLGNLLVIIGMVVVFIAALVIPFPKGRRDR